MAGWLVWVIIAGVLGVAELHSATLVLGMLAVAALPAALVAALGAGPASQVVTFTIFSVLLLAVVRPVARRHRHLPAALRTGSAALVGRQAVVVSPVDDHGGQVRIGGEVWSARLYTPGEPAAVGSAVDVLEIEGATALVLPLDPPHQQLREQP
jgi:membrane protein implicated in regulation of membrane protease activity